MLAHATLRTAWTLHYHLYKAYYLAQCENKDKPDLNCAGQCCLKKQIAASEGCAKKTPQLPQVLREIHEIQLFFELEYLCDVLKVFKEEQVALPPYQRLISDAPRAGVFKPPVSGSDQPPVCNPAG